MKKLIALFIMVVGLVVLITACSGGGGSGSEFGEIIIPPDINKKFEVDFEMPVDGTTGVAPNSVLEAILNDEIDQASIKDGIFSVVQGASSFSGTVSAIGKKGVGFTHDANFQPLSAVVVTLSGLKNKSGVTMERKIWIFVIGSELDTKPPEVKNISPVQGAVASPNTDVSITFDELDPLLLSGDTIKFIVINSDTGEQIAGNIKGYINTIVFTPEAALSPGHYRVIVVGAKDSAGNVITVPYIWNFSTVAPTVTTVNFITANWLSYSKGGNAQATFDKAAGKATVNTAGEASDVSARWAPLDIIKGKSYHISFSCNSVPQRNVGLQLKKNGGDYLVYDSLTVACAGRIEVDMIPDGDDSLGRFNINFGAATGVYTIGTVTVTY